ncbi:MAG: HPr kinase/phosphatase C-terminal domain-containing protein [Alphaproteobacteria bacterium]|nr:HPr kinase/phosphatase C-terminal domain-containing protein [Alphaproteobacteria bacterium]MBO4643127.1 HPr kinase/phosphatase C-terminal domain-containing protein [Alphaproteobacteria bacterium]
MPLIHASCVEFASEGLLICGESGAGKSDLCLRLTDIGAQLVADDQTRIENRGGKLIASCPEKLQGLLEVRGIGIVKTPFIEETEIHLKLILRPNEKIDRMPEIRTEIIEGVRIPVFLLNAFEASAVSKIKTFLQVQNGQRKVVS